MKLYVESTSVYLEKGISGFKQPAGTMPYALQREAPSSNAQAKRPIILSVSSKMREQKDKDKLEKEDGKKVYVKCNKAEKKVEKSIYLGDDNA